ncbi:MAG: ribosome silencing factor [Oscillospiraceae bacterium]|nr:ribosome silencing factor [Oscillospiraceae bacterium]
MEPKKLAGRAAKILSDKKAAELRVLEVTDLTTLGDYFVFATGTSTTHLKTLAEEVEYVLKKEGVLPKRVEGKAGGSWTLMDYGAVVIHVMLREAREFYAIERLWSDAKSYGEDEI